MTTKIISKILIANRGEIAVRVTKTAQAMGIKCVAVYSEADKGALFTEIADEAYLIGPAAVSESYLKADKILEVAKQSSADAIHPGYGFLSENADFADQCAANNIAFIGPSGDAIRAMGLKDKAKALMADAGVPIVPGYHGEEQVDTLLAKEAERIGYPVLIKAVSGGGGKGMRRVDDPNDFANALKSAQSEGQSSFGDPRVLIEKYIEKPRHIEIQVFADGHGNAVHLFERDCSLQRRHQKVVEEAPAPGMKEELRHQMGSAAVKAAKAIGYQGAGTVEFIVDVANGLDDAPFYFMEMNTRLQVEHPVTEAITGTDLVEWQIRVARGEALPKAQEDLSIEGHAFEIRLYAEDPDNDFLPAIGRLKDLQLHEDSGIRVDTGVRSGDEISIFYDPMIAKIITYGPDRSSALQRMADALDNSHVLGLTTNKAFLSRIMAHPAFQKGDVDTGFIPRYLDELLPSKSEIAAPLFIMAALARLLERKQRAQLQAETSQDRTSPWHDSDGWRLNLPALEALRFTRQGNDIEIQAVQNGGYISISYDDVTYQTQGQLAADGTLTVNLDGRQYKAHVAFDDESLILTHNGFTLALDKAITHVEDAGDAEAMDQITAPMPGKILSLNVKAGEQVQKDDTLIILEAMKMEHSLKAVRDGVIEEVMFDTGDQVQEGNILLTMEKQ